MVNLTSEQIRNLMNKIENIRNISIISNIYNGKSTIIKQLNENSGINILNSAISKTTTTTTATTTTLGGGNENKKENYTQPTPLLPLYFEKDVGELNEKSYLINLMNIKSSYEITKELSSSFRITDGLLIVVDCIDGGARSALSSLEIKLRMAVSNELLKPALIISKLDRLFLELNSDLEEIYHSFNKIIEDFNSILSITTITTTTLGNNETNNHSLISPNLNNIFFSSGLNGFGFSILNFAKLYSMKFGVPIDKMTEKLWGDNYYDAENKKWANSPFKAGVYEKNKPNLKRSFVQFILEPIHKLKTVVMENNQVALKSMLAALFINLTVDELILKGKPLFIVVMKKWFPFTPNLLSMCVNYFPSPMDAQKYRVLNLYQGPMNDECAIAISKCDKNGPLMMFISNVIPSILNRGRYYNYYGIGRIFSGTINTTQKLRILGPDFKPGSKFDAYSGKSIKDILFINNDSIESIINDADESNANISCGNIIGVFGIDQFIFKQATLTNSEIANIIKSLKCKVTPIVKVAVEPKNPADLPKLMEGLKRLSRDSQSNVITYTEYTGEHVIAGSTESQINVGISDLCKYFSMEVQLSDPFISYRESVSMESSKICLSKSPNKHNRLCMKATPISLALQNEIESNQDLFSNSLVGIGTSAADDIKNSLKKRNQCLVDDFGWDSEDARKIWTFSPTNVNTFLYSQSPIDSQSSIDSTNILVDQTRGVQYLNEIKDSIIYGFNWAVAQGALCEEPMRGIRFNLVDVSYFSDAIHRGGGQIIPTSRRVIYGSQLTAQPNILEPLYEIDISTLLQSALPDIYQLITKRRGIIINEYKSNCFNLNGSGGSNKFNIKAHLPVAESFGFEIELKFISKGFAWLEQCSFNHWSQFGNGSIEKSEIALKLVTEIRKRKGLKLDIPTIDYYLDKL